MPKITASRPWRHLYNTAKWQRLRRRQLLTSPLCVMCAEQGRIEVATVVDHIKEHKGETELFFNPENLQSLCEPHHNTTKQRFEVRGYMAGSDMQGIPIATNHHWNA